MTNKIPVFDNVNRDMESVTTEVKGGRIEEMQLQGGGLQDHRWDGETGVGQADKSRGERCLWALEGWSHFLRLMESFSRNTLTLCI